MGWSPKSFPSLDDGSRRPLHFGVKKEKVGGTDDSYTKSATCLNREVKGDSGQLRI
jgi:hypothetical protein